MNMPQPISISNVDNFKEMTHSQPSLGLIAVKHKKKLIERVYNSGMDFSGVPEGRSMQRFPSGVGNLGPGDGTSESSKNCKSFSCNKVIVRKQRLSSGGLRPPQNLMLQQELYL
jgi:hypothetical protein